MERRQAVTRETEYHSARGGDPTTTQSPEPCGWCGSAGIEESIGGENYYCENPDCPFSLLLCRLSEWDEIQRATRRGRAGA